MHRAFLKSGSARVMLPTRPGFERSFLDFYPVQRTVAVIEHLDPTNTLFFATV